MLPTITIDGVTYYFDARLAQLRNVNNPHEAVDLSDRDVEVLMGIAGDCELHLRAY